MTSVPGKVTEMMPGEKRDTMVGRLKAREEERRAKTDRRREEQQENVSTVEEQVSKFEAEFGEACSRLETLLSLGTEDVVSSGGGVSEHLDVIERQLQQLQKLASDAQLFLPAFAKHKTNVAAAVLQQRFVECQELLLGRQKKKFAFKSRSATGRPRKDAAASEVVDGVPAMAPWTAIDCGFCDVTGQTLSKSAAEATGNDVALHRLTGCTVAVYGSPSAVHATDLNDCSVSLGPVATSVMVRRCTRVKFAVACQQLRVHGCADCDFRVHVTSRTAIEDCRRLRFGPYDWAYDGIDDDFARAGLVDRGDKWKEVDDFDWLVQDAPSPHWTVLDGTIPPQ